MAEIHTCDGRRLPLRPALYLERERAWQRLASPGTWFDGATRLAIASETRRVAGCALCARRCAALSPYGIDGTHDGDGVLPETLVEVVHRVRSDSGRLTRAWLEGIRAAGISDEEYVETLGVVAVITALDTFDHALGMPLRTLPAPRPGAPTRQRPVAARIDHAWVPTTAPGTLRDDEPDPYPVHGDKHIHQALSLVPREVFNFFDLDVELYLKDHEIRDFDSEFRALSHAQIELMAGRASAINGCYY
jgi:alkylhydroperoxidase family enzyme